MRSPSTNGDVPSEPFGQSLIIPVFSRGDVYCQRNLPSDARKHISTLMSIGSGFLVMGWSFLGSVNWRSRGLSLLVLTQTRPSATTGPPMLELPSLADHAMLRDVCVTFPLSSRASICQSVGAFFSGLTALCVRSRPNVGQSSARVVCAHASARRTGKVKRVMVTPVRDRVMFRCGSVLRIQAILGRARLLQ